LGDDLIDPVFIECTGVEQLMVVDMIRMSDVWSSNGALDDLSALSV